MLNLIMTSRFQNSRNASKKIKDSSIAASNIGSLNAGKHTPEGPIKVGRVDRVKVQVHVVLKVLSFYIEFEFVLTVQQTSIKVDVLRSIRT